MERKVEGDETEEDINPEGDERGYGSLTTTSLTSTTTFVACPNNVLVPQKHYRFKLNPRWCTRNQLLQTFVLPWYMKRRPPK